jgi:hypothetical protein
VHTKFTTDDAVRTKEGEHEGTVPTDEAALDRLLYYFCMGHQRTATFYKERPDLLPPVSWTFHNNKGEQPTTTPTSEPTTQHVDATNATSPT